jgi:hypothetical protein
VNNFVVGATMTDNGWGYTNTPAVRIIDGGGAGAQAVAVVSNGMVTAVNVLAAGSGYTNTPLVVIAPPFIAQPGMSSAAMVTLSFANLAVGTNYQLQSMMGGKLSNMGAAFTATNTSLTQYAPGIASMSSYRLAAAPVPSQAYATGLVVNGFVVGVTVTNGGAGYVSSPLVSIVGGGGSNATATASVNNGVVSAVAIISPGSGYSIAPSIIIAPPPPGVVLWPMVSQAIGLNLSNLSPYDTYQVEFQPVLGGTWSNLGSLFIPTATTNTQLVNVGDVTGLLRVRYVP